MHTNGWADGTMLSSGARGWLPTNYCEGYDLEQIRPLLRACLSLFDQCKGGGNHQGGNQGVVTGVVAGVRYLLVGFYLFLFAEDLVAVEYKLDF